jgi:phosphonate ABC transporter permease subunit PhnE
LGTTTSTLGQSISDGLNPKAVKITNLISSAIAGALLFVLIGAVINWFYQIDNPSTVYYWPAAVGALIGLGLAIRSKPKDTLSIGITLYFIMRTILNTTRSVEPLVMVIVFVAWVGIGPFAGALALSLHTIAALSKLYSEQVESILPGPLEAITATGANRLQTIVYAVVPQIVPPYISFTMYRWDINVRMSTIIGFAGGGGIGFLLQQNINLLDYRAASAQMLAIAIVVASMDYVSSTLRERFV